MKKPADYSAGFSLQSIGFVVTSYHKTFPQFRYFEISTQVADTNVRAAYVCSSTDRAVQWLWVGCGFESRQAYTNLEAPESPTGASLFGGGDIVGLRF